MTARGADAADPLAAARLEEASAAAERASLRAVADEREGIDRALAAMRRAIARDVGKGLVSGEYAALTHRRIDEMRASIAGGLHLPPPDRSAGGLHLPPPDRSAGGERG